MTSLRPSSHVLSLYPKSLSSVSILLLSCLTISAMLMFSILFCASVHILIGTGALAGLDPCYRCYRKPSLADKLTARQAAGSVPASEFVRRAFQGCKCWCDLRSIHRTLTCCQQLLSWETGSILTEVKFPTMLEASTMSTVSFEPYGELIPRVDGMDVSNNTAFC